MQESKLNFNNLFTVKKDDMKAIDKEQKMYIIVIVTRKTGVLKS